MLGTSGAGGPWHGAVAQQLRALPGFRNAELVSPLTQGVWPLTRVQQVPPVLPHVTALRLATLDSGMPPARDGGLCEASGCPNLFSDTKYLEARQEQGVWVMPLARPVWQRSALGSSPCCAMLARVHLAPSSPRTEILVGAGSLPGPPGERSLLSGMGLCLRLLAHMCNELDGLCSP